MLITYASITLIFLISIFIIWNGSNRKMLPVKFLLALSGCILCWTLCYILYYLTDNAGLARILYDVKIPFVALSTLFTFCFTLSFFKLEKRVHKAVWILILMIPLMTTVFAFTSPLHTILRTSLVIEIGPLNIADNHRGWWYWVHTAYCYGMMMVSFIVIIYQYIRQVSEIRAASRYMVLAITLAVGTNTCALTGIFAIPVDVTLIGLCPALILFYMALSTSERIGFLQVAKGEIFDLLLAPIFITNDQDVIISKNLAADQWLREQGAKGDGTYSRLLEELKDQGATTSVSEEDGSVEITVIRGDNTLTYKMRDDLIGGKRAGMAGRFVLLEDVTKTNRLIATLSRHAGNDPLTGLQNRYAFEKAKLDYDKPEYWPLAVVYGDLDSLKIINDKMGHKMGDNYLIEAAKRLEEICGESGSAYRIGGDEFVMLLPQCTVERSNEIVLKAQESVASIDGLPASISLGSAVKERADQNLDFLIEDADARMYELKQLKKRQKK